MDIKNYNLKIYYYEISFFKIFIPFLFFCLNPLYSQSYEDIKKLDTIYIVFKQGKYNVKIDYPEEKNGFKNKGYFFNYKKMDKRTFRFELDRNRILESKEINKSFKKKNKKKILKINALKNFDYQDVSCSLFNRLKVIYIIDFSEKKNRTIMLYRVISLNLCYAKE